MAATAVLENACACTSNLAVKVEKEKELDVVQE
jgi:hypothetical protein